MDGRAFLDIARDLAAGPAEAHWRTAAGRSYDALFHEGLWMLLRWGFIGPPRDNVHTFVRLRFIYATDPDLKSIGRSLEALLRLRNDADYQLAAPGPFVSARRVTRAIDVARDAIALLDQIDGDPIRRGAAIAAIRPCSRIRDAASRLQRRG